MAIRQSRLQRLVGTLKRRYGRLPEPPADAFALFVWQVLFNHSTPKKRDAAVSGLKRLHALTPDGMWNASPKALRECVHRAGPFGEYRLLALRKGVEVFRRDSDWPVVLKGPVPAALRRLKVLPRMSGDGPAYCMLLFAGDQAVLPVNARVARVATRLGYGQMAGAFPKIAKSIRQAIAPELGSGVAAYRDAYVCFEHHGATTCTETDPGCDVCPLRRDCPHRQSLLV
jgi:endonuclease III